MIADLTNALMSMQLSGKFPPFLLMGAGLMAWEFSAVMAAFAPDFRQDCMHHGAPDFAMEKTAMTLDTDTSFPVIRVGLTDGC